MTDAHNLILLDHMVPSKEVGALLDVEGDPFTRRRNLRHIATRVYFPYSQRVKLPYRMTKLNTFSGSSFQSTHKLSTNDVFDPDPAVGGDQPSGHDAMAARYQRYIVLGCKVKAHIWNDTANYVDIGLVIQSKSEDDAHTWTQREIQNLRTNKKGMFVKKRFSGGAADNEQERKTLALEWRNPAQFLQGSEDQNNGSVEERFFGLSATTSPAELIKAYLVGCRTYTDAAIPVGVDVLWEMTMDVMYYKPVSNVPHDD